MKKYVVLSLLLMGLMFPVLSQAQVLLQDAFGGSALDTAKWKIDCTDPGTVVVANGRAECVCGNGGWGEKGIFSSVDAWERTSGSKVLQAQWDVDYSAGDPSQSYYISGFHDNSWNPNDYISCWHGMCMWAGSKIIAWQSGGTGATTLPSQFDCPRQHSVRVTLDPVIGAKYEFNNGTSWAAIADTRGVSGDSVYVTPYILRFDNFSGHAGDKIYIDNVLVQYVDPPPVGTPVPTNTPTPTPTPATAPPHPTPDPGATVLLQDDFSGANLDPAKWKVDAGSVSVVSGAVDCIAGSTGWGTNAFSSVAAWNRTDGGSKVLRFIYEADMRNATTAYYLVGFHPDEWNSGSDYFHLWYGNIFFPGGPIQAWQSNGSGGSTISPSSACPLQHLVRVTLGATEGALIERHNGLEWTTVSDTRGVSGDTGTSYIVRFDNFDPNAGTIHYDNIIVEYVTAPAVVTPTTTPTPSPTPIPASTPGVILQDDFSGSSIDTAKWTTHVGETGATFTQSGGVLTIDCPAPSVNTYGNYIMSNAPFARPSAPNFLRWTCDVKLEIPSGNSVAYGIGFYPAGAYSSYASWKYFDAGVNTSAITFSEAWSNFSAGSASVSATGDPNGFYSMRVSLAPGSAPGGIFEYDARDGNGWHTVANTLSSSTYSPVDGSFQFIVDTYYYSASHLVIDNVVVECVGPAATPTATVVPPVELSTFELE